MKDRQGHTPEYLLESWIELREAVELHPEIRKLLFDPVTGLPTTPLLFPRIQVLLEERGEVSLLCLNVVRYSKIEEIYGWEVFDDVMRETAAALESITGVDLRDSDIIAELMISGNSFVVVLSPPRNTLHMDDEALGKLCLRVEERIREVLSAALEPALFRKFGCYAGATKILRDQGTRLERLVHDGLERALAESASREATDGERRTEGLRNIIADEEVRTVVHPIVRLSDLAVIGYEALARGPVGGEFERPDKLFAVAYDADLVFKLERLCRKRAMQVARDLPDEKLFFLNIEPEAVADPELREMVFSTLLSDLGMTPDRIVLEITERCAIDDFRAFRATLEYLRAVGFAIAVDDGGAGYSSLQCLAEVRPEWLKIDMSLIRGIDTDKVRESLVASLVAFCERIGVKLVAEGIETEPELDAVKRLGVEYGQGFLFSLPVDPYPADDVVKQFLLKRESA